MFYKIVYICVAQQIFQQETVDRNKGPLLKGRQTNAYFVASIKLKEKWFRFIFIKNSTVEDE